ncbi:SpvB/TcaC N-terminal domain-containing protein [Pantoea sp. B65]|uniref:SpvB/TcaC N-terminal domain-containing protein n=1 Tax=Pantoea sp. B65 TaxID=2813359 RepID=UPI0039B531BC
MQTTEQLRLNPPSLPAGGGAISGIKSDMPTAGPDGAASLNITLPISAGRGYAPPLALNYHSQAGNGPFGIGWSVDQPAVRRRTRQGAPLYNDDDEFIGADGEVLVAVLTSSNTPETRRASSLLGDSLGSTFRVSSYRSRIESSFSRFEYWLSESANGGDFWLLYTADGQMHLLGRTPQARISNPQTPTQTAVWLLESSISLTGEQIYYQYRAEDDTNCSAAELAAHPNATAQRYLVAAYYGNKVAGRKFPTLIATLRDYDWLFVLKFDYGTRSSGTSDPPSWQKPDYGAWPIRPDCFSSFEYGFDLRTRRQCNQVLMFHRLNSLRGSKNEGEPLELISRLLLTYSLNPSISTLKSVELMAYEPGSKARLNMPALEFDWQSFTPPTTANWQQRDDPGKMNMLQPYQLVDLNGEGLAGVLYQDDGAWWYRAPERSSGNDPDAVSWGSPAPLATIPTLRNGGTLADLNGDGYLEWIITAAGVAGHYDRTPEREWLHFTPLSALPVEYSHPRAQLADVLGGGLADMVLIGPRSVRLYAGKKNGWQPAQTVVQSDGITLPVPGADDRVLVAFTDMAGSGQQHLTEVRASGVRYWPNLGHGRFAPPVSLPGFSQPAESFNPDQLFMADIEGSGTTDLLYALSDRLLVYRNQSGNSFAAPFTVMLPGGVRYDRTCSLQLADIQGLGVTSLLLTVPHPQPRHWLCNLSTRKPWLLIAMDNNMGARHALYYRSSAQFWLDEKAEAVAAGKAPPPCYLPFAVHTLWRTEVTDQITGNKLVSSVRYRHGAWDGEERELHGFGFVEISDTDTIAAGGSAKEISMPAINRSWYATGLPELDKRLADEYWSGDTAAFAGFTPRYTHGSGANEQTYTPDDNSQSWLRRGLKGMLLRSELYGADNSLQQDIPYSVSEYRPQVRLVVEKGNYPVVWPAIAVSRTYLYERFSSDPQCSEQLLLASDDYGQPLRQLSIYYPRRSKPDVSPWPDSLPETLFASSYDDQQQLLRLHLQQNSWHHLAALSNSNWLLGLANASREDAFTHPASNVPARGLTLEALLAGDSLVADSQSYTLVGQQQIWYLNGQNQGSTDTPALPPRIAFIETAGLDEEMVTALAGSITAEHLTQAGWQQSAYLFARSAEASKKLWIARQGHTTYDTAAHYWLPLTYRETTLTGAVTVTRSAWDCVVTVLKEADGLTTTASYDWRFLQPVRITDANDNLHVATLDALGRVTSTSFSGTEEGKAAGYSATTMAVPDTVDRLLAIKPPMKVAQCILYIADSWAAKSVTKDTWKLPPHVVTLTSDRYDNDAEQQIRQQVVFSDGFGRVLQTSVRHENGEAWQYAVDGNLVEDSDGSPKVAQSSFRWAISGRTEYDNKGQAVRTYQPYFLDSWKYLRDDSARKDLYADTFYYDPVGRVCKVETAKGWLRRSLYTPWFVVNEDENDTAAEVEEARNQKTGN